MLKPLRLEERRNTLKAYHDLSRLSESGQWLLRDKVAHSQNLPDRGQLNRRGSNRQLFGISRPAPKLASIWLKIVGRVYPPTPQEDADEPSEKKCEVSPGQPDDIHFIVVHGVRPPRLDPPLPVIPG